MHERPRLADGDHRLARGRRAAARRSRRSPPLNRPPMIGTSAASKLSIARRADSTLVAFESLTNRTPPTVADRLQRVLEPREASRPRPARPARSRRPAGATAAAASDVAEQVPPDQLHRGDRHAAASRSRHARARRSSRRRTNTALVERPFHRERAGAARAPAAPPAPAPARRRRSPPPSRRAPGSRRCAPWPRSTRSTVACRSRWSGEKFSSTAIHGWNVVGRLELEAARLDHVDRVAASSRRPARSAARRCCRRPAPAARPPRASGRRASSSSTSPSCR